MVVESHFASLIRTKLHRPRVPGDNVCRQRLHEVLEAGRDRPLTLVSAPAGYGKSNLVSHWLEESRTPSAWLSLDEGDSDLKTFLAYFLSAIRTVFPEGCPDSLAVIGSQQLPAIPRLAGVLVNELDALEGPITLVLDDYHRLGNPVIHDLMNELLKHQPRPFHLALITRRDPPLALHSLRVKNVISEVRQQDLRLTAAEIAELVERAAGVPLTDSAVGTLEERLEGWAAGLRLVALALQDRDDVDAVLRRLSVDTRHIREYLVEEVLDQQSPVIHDCLCKTSILDRFCATLCDAVLGAGDKPEPGTPDGGDFIKWLVEANLFCINLDERNEWNRYHHLFQELLRSHLASHYSPEEIADLHRRASAWFEENGYFEEALRHMMATGDIDAAADLLSRFRHDLINREQWHRLILCLNRFSPETVEENIDLSSLKAFLLQRRGMFREAWQMLDVLEPRLPKGELNTESENIVLGEFLTLRCFQHFAAAEGEEAGMMATEALRILPLRCQGVRSLAVLLRAAAMQMCGDLAGARKSLQQALVREGEATHFKSLCLSGFGFLDQIAADFHGLAQSAPRYLEHGRRQRLPESMIIGRYFMGTLHYLTNNLDEAEEVLAPALHEKAIANFSYHAHSIILLALTLEARGKSGRAREAVQQLLDMAMEANNTFLLHLVGAFQAELNLRQGRVTDAVDWFRDVDPPWPPITFRYYVPHLTKVRVLLAEKTPESLARCAELLERLHDLFASTFSTRLLIDVLALKALLDQVRGDETSARAALQQAVTMAVPTGLIRPFVDLGPELGKLLQRLELDGEALQYVGWLLAAFHREGTLPAGEPDNGKAARPAQPLVEPLTNRELEILALLDQRLSNREIADRLFISIETVKKHTGNIFGKLGVRNRRQAVDKASGLGIIPGS